MENYRYKRYAYRDSETRWATVDEVKNASDYVDLSERTTSAAGLPVLSDGAEAYVDDTDTHSIIFGTTGSKKTRLFCMPMLGLFIKAGESFIATDPKGELYRQSAGMARDYGYETLVLNLRDIGTGDQWNPLSLPYELYHSGDEEGAVARLNDFVRTLAEPQFENTKDVFWPEMACSYALANLMLLMECGDSREANVISLSRMCSTDVEGKLKELADQMSVYSIAGMNYRGVLSAAEKTRQSIYVSLYGMLRVFNTQKNLSAMLSGNTIDLKSIGRKKTALYIIIPDEKTTLHFLVTTFIKQAYEILISEAQKEPNGELPIRVNFLLDEFCNIPKIPDMPSMISAARSRNMRYFLVAQSLHQLRGLYGEDADTIKGNCSNWVFLTSRELDLLQEISDLCGSTVTAGGKPRRLISVAELQRLNKARGEALILLGRQYPFITAMADISQYSAFSGYPDPPLKRIEGMEYRIFSVDRLYEKILLGEMPVPFLKQKEE